MPDHADLTALGLTLELAAISTAVLLVVSLTGWPGVR